MTTAPETSRRVWPGRPHPLGAHFDGAGTNVAVCSRPFRKRGEGAVPDIAWLTPGGSEMTNEEWNAGSRSHQVFLDGDGIATPDERGERIHDDSFLVVFHADGERGTITLPEVRWGAAWREVFDTERGFTGDDAKVHAAAAVIEIEPRSLWLFRREPP